MRPPPHSPALPRTLHRPAAMPSLCRALTTCSPTPHSQTENPSLASPHIALSRSYAITLSGFDDVQPDPELASDPVAVRQASERLQRNEFFRDCLAAKDIKVKVRARGEWETMVKWKA